MTTTKTILDTVDLLGSFPTIACRTGAGWLVVRFDGDQLYIGTPWQEQAKELDIDYPDESSVVANNVAYQGWINLRDEGWGDEEGHDAYYSSWRIGRKAAKGWLDRECAYNWTRTGTLGGAATGNAKVKLRDLAERVAAELIASRPGLVEIGKAAALRRQIANAEEELDAAERKAHGLQTEIEDLRTRLEAMSK